MFASHGKKLGGQGRANGVWRPNCCWTATVPSKALSKLSLRARLLLAMALLAAIAVLREQAVGMNAVLFQRSLPGAKALLLYAVGDYAGAARAYRAHFRQRVQSGRGVGSPASNALIAGNLKLAERLARAELERTPAVIEPMLILGEVALERRELAEASAMFRRVLDREADHLDALMLASVAHARAGAYGDAIEAVNRALRHDAVGLRLTGFLSVMATTGELGRRPVSERPLCMLAHYHRYLRVFDGSQARPATRYAERAIAAGDRPADAYVTLGAIHDKRRKPEDALIAFLKAIELEPKHAEAYRRAGVIYADRGDDGNAYRMFKAAFEAAPSDPFYILPLDHVLMQRLADPYQVVEVMSRALEVNPDNVRAHDRLGYAYGFIGDQDRSIEHYRKAIALEPRNPALHEGLGWELDRMGRIDDAVAAYRRAMAVAPARYQSHTLLANVYHRRYKFSEAIAEYEIALRLGEPRVEEQSALCVLYHSTSQFERGLACFRSVLTRDPSNVRARRMLAESENNVRLLREAR